MFRLTNSIRRKIIREAMYEEKKKEIYKKGKKNIKVV